MADEPPEADKVDIPDEGDGEASRVEELEKEIQYAKAEIANIRQRAARERSDLLRYGGASLANRIIPMVDVLTKAVESSEGGDSVIEGVRLTLEGIRTALESEGIVQIEALGNAFDPTCMEAIATIPCPEDSLPGSVIEVIEQGYRMHDRILRAARVIVAEGDS
ncbi:MAG: nucleotide exchange factor GrpE [Candidatus Thalassarchaeaceae archaeon]|nr:nucleotide exchange factor GrpE [Candidatus Thalassarchaeaceae archaeon]MEE2630387.1 nucleotide exchange factor GrpE [Candidatus Thermoplasmatota archaeon]